MKNDDNGQFLLLTAIVVAVGLVVLLVFINQSSMSGHSSSESIMNFPKNDIRELRTETVSEAIQIAQTDNANASLVGASAKMNHFNSTFDVYINDIKKIYAQHGSAVNVSYGNVDNGAILTNTTLKLSYSDGDTSYHETYPIEFGY
jgi:hypothetical protein